MPFQYGDVFTIRNLCNETLDPLATNKKRIDDLYTIFRFPMIEEYACNGMIDPKCNITEYNPKRPRFLHINK